MKKYFLLSSVLFVILVNAAFVYKGDVSLFWQIIIGVGIVNTLVALVLHVRKLNS